jgi:glycosyltransferase involved in cell wall biosynthesis
MLVENLSVPFDRRVWQEARTLTEAGARVVVVCPRGSTRDRGKHEVLEGIEICRFDLPSGAGGVAGYVIEYALALARIRRVVAHLVRTGHRFDVVHAANPPDLLLPAVWRLRRSARFVFDHHDLAPELFRTRFGRRGVPFRLLEAAERLSFRLAHVVIATNDSYRDVATGRGGKAAEDVFVVRNAPDLEIFAPAPGTGRPASPHLLAYVGMMGPQDGVDQALRALASLRARRSDWRAVLAGDGDARPGLEALASELGLDDAVTFAGVLTQDDVVALLRKATVCLAPEPRNPLNEVSTMMKVAEYLAMGRPVVAFDLLETRRTAGDSAIYAPDRDVEAFADAIGLLLDDPDLRSKLGATGRARIESSLSWDHSRDQLLAAYRRALAGARR